ncbi:uncharacterized protein LOC135951351 [Calliphora vicina]|uniref:uncharacterized protein LOC135951351 n=1 Tax=Calliphora vicina TaxID=7373 RepID=UPI00325BB45C
MRKLMVFCTLIAMVAADDQGYNYNLQYEISSSRNLEEQPILKSAKDTEYFHYTAPDDVNDVTDARRLAGLLHPQRVVFIKNPENNIFSRTAEELAKQQSLNIYVLQRQMDFAGLRSQLQEIRDRVEHKPNVQFIKYRTPDDIERAKQAVYNDFESIPGPSKYHQNHQTPIYEFDAKTQQLHSVQQELPTQPPVIFEIIRRPTAATISQVSTQESIKTPIVMSAEEPSTKSLEYLPSPSS